MTLTNEDLGLSERVGHNVRVLLKQRGKSVAGLAREFGVTSTTMHNRLSGKHKLAIDDLPRIAAYLDLDEFGVLFRENLFDLGLRQSGWTDVTARQLTFDDALAEREEPVIEDVLIAAA